MKNYFLILADPIDWPLIGTIIGLFALAALAVCSCLCCRYLWFVYLFWIDSVIIILYDCLYF
jgi:hypothetical protein